MYKTVNYQVEVPNSKNCVKKLEFGLVFCQFFNNSGGYPKCSLGFTGLEKVNDGVAKPRECLELS